MVVPPVAPPPCRHSPRSVARPRSSARSRSFSVRSRLAGAQTLGGQVVQLDTKKPIGGAAVALVNDSARVVASASAGPDGAFYLDAPAAGVYRARAPRLGWIVREPERAPRRRQDRRAAVLRPRRPVVVRHRALRSRRDETGDAGPRQPRPGLPARPRRGGNPGDDQHHVRRERGGPARSRDLPRAQHVAQRAIRRVDPRGPAAHALRAREEGRGMGSAGRAVHVRLRASRRSRSRRRHDPPAGAATADARRVRGRRRRGEVARQDACTSSRSTSSPSRRSRG